MSCGSTNMTRDVLRDIRVYALVPVPFHHRKKSAIYLKGLCLMIFIRIFHKVGFQDKGSFYSWIYFSLHIASCTLLAFIV